MRTKGIEERLDDLEKKVREMYEAYQVQCKFLTSLKNIHEEWDRSDQTLPDVKHLLDRVHNECQRWYSARVARGAS